MGGVQRFGPQVRGNRFKERPIGDDVSDPRRLELTDVEPLHAADDEKVRDLQEREPRNEHKEDLSEDRVGQKGGELLLDVAEEGGRRADGVGHGTSFSTGTASM